VTAPPFAYYGGKTLDGFEACVLFADGNTWDDLRAITHMLVHERPEVTR
jgi:hypothetical protein